MEFIFKYRTIGQFLRQLLSITLKRSEDQLIANDIAPAPPKAANNLKRSVVDKDIIEIEDSEGEQAKAEVHDPASHPADLSLTNFCFQAVSARIVARRTKKKVKREPQDIKPVFLPGEVIDLT